MYFKRLIQIVSVCCLCSWVCADFVITPWEPKFQGVVHATGYTEQPRLQRVNAIRVDLFDPDVRLMTTPSNGGAPGDTVHQTGSQFMSEFGVQIGVNGQFIDTVNRPPWPNGELLGLAINQGQVVSAAEDLHTLIGVNPGTLLVTENMIAHIQITTPATNLSGYWTAIESWPWLLVNGANHGDPRTEPASTFVHPRTAIGLTLGNRYLIIITIDGRQPGFSDGATAWETAEWLKRFGAYNGLNLDGGGSTHLWISESYGSTYALNSPSENRSVGNHLGIFAAPLPFVFNPRQVFADFEDGPATFWLTPGYSGSTVGINKPASSSALTTETAYRGAWSQKLTIIDDPAVSNGWLVRHVSGSNASRSQNVIRPTQGYVGLWAKTTSPNLEISMAIDNTYNVTADRGTFRPMQADGQWHLYEWNLESDNDWHGWASGSGLIDTPDFTIDSIQIRTAANQDAVIYLDQVVHFSRGSIHYWDSLPGDFVLNGHVHMADFAAFASHWLRQASDPEWNRIFDLDANADGVIDIEDLLVFVEHWLQE